MILSAAESCCYSTLVPAATNTLLIDRTTKSCSITRLRPDWRPIVDQICAMHIYSYLAGVKVFRGSEVVEYSLSEGPIKVSKKDPQYLRNYSCHNCTVRGQMKNAYWCVFRGREYDTNSVCPNLSHGSLSSRALKLYVVYFHTNNSPCELRLTSIHAEAETMWFHADVQLAQVFLMMPCHWTRLGVSRAGAHQPSTLTGSSKRGMTIGSLLFPSR
ncbi:hypothetical protein PROFUN_01574 [Planoprotostelium fungivorum]|uniref:Uncharacterized protein n=1 Tax=Planoprotostelium fungivorum TaxID=1890364 RepID=A0A2P6NTM0_9EUKA|nr:hypothetical protein PROFUN_01574 [Planoprotostelium fungivorum]